MKKETAVEWLVEELFKTIDYIQVNPKLIEQAKAMFEEQIIDAWEDGQGSFSTRTVEQYYNETYGK